MRVLVTGATGFVGGRLVPALRAAGHEVVALARDADGYDGPADEVREGDVLDPGSFEVALDGIETAVERALDVEPERFSDRPAECARAD